MLKVFVALGKQLPKNKAILEDTQDVAKLLAKYNCTMYQGGAKTGLMGLVVDEFQKYSEEVVMIVPEAHKSDLDGTKNKESHIVESESDRLKLTTKDCDLMVVLPGGSGTLVELAYYNETRKSGEHNAKIVVVNTNGYYNTLFKFFKHQVKSGFLKQESLDDMFRVVKNAKGLELVLQELITEKQEELNKHQVKAEVKKECKCDKVDEQKSAKKATCKKDKIKEEAKAKSEVAEKSAKSTAKKVETKKASKKVAQKPKPKKAEVAEKIEKNEVKEEVKEEVKAPAKAKTTSKAPAKAKTTSKTTTKSKAVKSVSTKARTSKTTTAKKTTKK